MNAYIMVRPVVETGYENVLLVRLLLEPGDENSFSKEVIGGYLKHKHFYFSVGRSLISQLYQSSDLFPSVQLYSSSLWKVAAGLMVQGILDNWFKIKLVIMAEWGEKRDPLIDLFGKVRDEWIDNDLAGLIGANRAVLLMHCFESLPESLFQMKESMVLEPGENIYARLWLWKENKSFNSSDLVSFS